MHFYSIRYIIFNNKFGKKFIRNLYFALEVTRDMFAHLRHKISKENIFMTSQSLLNFLSSSFRKNMGSNTYKTHLKFIYWRFFKHFIFYFKGSVVIVFLSLCLFISKGMYSSMFSFS